MVPALAITLKGILMIRTTLIVAAGLLYAAPAFAEVQVDG